MSHVWSLVLAAGRGRRLASLTGGVPKQFWSPDGGRTLLEQTLDRLTPLVPLTRTVTVIDRSQRVLAEARLRTSSRESYGHLLDQPCDRGTAAGVALGLTGITQADPDAIVVLTPSDHGVDRMLEFQQGVRRGAEAVATGREDLVLFGVQPDSAVGEYGWIAAGENDPGAWFRRVTAFVEKPPMRVAERLLAAGAVWNTMVMVARAAALLRLYDDHLPAVAGIFALARQLDPASRDAFLADAYDSIDPADFSRDLLTPASGLALYTWAASLGWSDLGTPGRLDAWMNQHTRHDSRIPAA